MATPRTRLSADLRRAEILRASLPLFAQLGLAATSVRAIARAAGVSEALLYKHFPSKEALYRALCKELGAAPGVRASTSR